MLVCIAADAFLYLAVRGMAQRSALKAKNDLLSAQIDRQKEHYAALTAQYANIRRMRHDIAKHLDTMQALLQSGQYQAAAAYSNEVSAQAQVQAHLGICENPIVDAYLFSRSQELERQGLMFSQRTSGRFITEDREMIEDAKRTLANRHISAFIRQMQALGYTRQEIVAMLEESERGEEHDANS